MAEARRSRGGFPGGAPGFGGVGRADPEHEGQHEQGQSGEEHEKHAVGEGRAAAADEGRRDGHGDEGEDHDADEEEEILLNLAAAGGFLGGDLEEAEGGEFHDRVRMRLSRWRTTGISAAARPASMRGSAKERAARSMRRVYTQQASGRNSRRKMHHLGGGASRCGFGPECGPGSAGPGRARPGPQEDHWAGAV